MVWSTGWEETGLLFNLCALQAHEPVVPVTDVQCNVLQCHTPEMCQAADVSLRQPCDTVVTTHTHSSQSKVCKVSAVAFSTDTYLKFTSESIQNVRAGVKGDCGRAEEVSGYTHVVAMDIALSSLHGNDRNLMHSVAGNRCMVVIA